MLNSYNQLAQACINHFNNLPKTGKPNANQWTVLSCIVKENTLINDSYEVVALGTGSKCIGKSKMSANGDILNDSHAEVICRRSFLRYLIDQMNENSDIFIFDSQISKYKLKDNLVFHFFTTKVPCGDATIFSKQDENDFGLIINCEKSSLKRPSTSEGQTVKKIKVNEDDTFRTGAKCLSEDTRQDLHLDGSEYHTTCAVRTKPGRGDPTLSVSCSDKIAKWCHLGWQGSNLSLLIKDPIHIKTFLVAGKTPYSESALKRAIFERLDEFKLSPELEHVDFVQTSVSFEFYKDDTKQACPSSISWCKINSVPLEVSIDGKKQGVTKKNYNRKSGRLKISKIELFCSCLNVVESLQLNEFKEVKLNQVLYCELKKMAKDYQNKWKSLKSAFKIWTVKDSALLQFTID